MTPTLHAYNPKTPKNYYSTYKIYDKKSKSAIIYYLNLQHIFFYSGPVFMLDNSKSIAPIMAFYVNILGV